jgi:hypothetical protein
VHKRKDVGRHFIWDESFIFASGGLQYGRMSVLLGGMRLKEIEKLTLGFGSKT